MGRGFRASALVPRKNAGEREGRETPGVSPLGTEHQLGGKLQLPRNLKGALTTNACAQPLAGTLLGEESPRRGWPSYRAWGTLQMLCFMCGAHQKSTILHPLHEMMPTSNWKPIHRSCGGGSFTNTEHWEIYFQLQNNLTERKIDGWWAAAPAAGS